MCNICNLLICVPVQYGMKGIDQQKRSSLNAYCHLCTWRNFSLQLAIIEKATTLLTTPFPHQIKNKAPLASIGSQTPSSVSFFRSTALLAIMQFQLQLNWNNIFLFRFRSAACDISFCLFLSPFAPHHTALQQSIFMQFLSARAEECCRFICLLAFSLSLCLLFSLFYLHSQRYTPYLLPIRQVGKCTCMAFNVFFPSIVNTAYSHTDPQTFIPAKHKCKECTH